MPAEATLAIAKAQVKREGGTQAAWRISYREEGGVIPRSVISIVRDDDLAPLERHYMYNGHTTRLMFGEKTVSDPDATSSQPLPLPQPVLASWEVALLALPLADGYETLARTFELLQETLHWKAAVVGAEAVSTPAGTFDAYKVALTSLDNDALSGIAWVTKTAPYRVVRREAPYTIEFPNGRVTMELARIDPTATPPAPTQ